MKEEEEERCEGGEGYGRARGTVITSSEQVEHSYYTHHFTLTT